MFKRRTIFGVIPFLAPVGFVAALGLMGLRGTPGVAWAASLTSPPLCSPHAGTPEPDEGSGACTGNFHYTYNFSRIDAALVYNSATAPLSGNSWDYFGRGWSFSFESRLSFSSDGTQATLETGDGSRFLFNRSPTNSTIYLPSDMRKGRLYIWLQPTPTLVDLAGTKTAFGQVITYGGYEGTTWVNNKKVYLPTISRDAANVTTFFITRNTAGRVTQFGGKGVRGATVVEQAGNILELKDASEGITRVQLDSMRRLNSVNEPDGVHYLIAQYDTLNLIELLDQRKNSTKIGYNANGFLSYVTDPLNYSTVYKYESNAVTTTNFWGSTVERFDGNGRLVVLSSPTDKVILSRDSAGRVYRIDSNTQVTNLAYMGSDIFPKTIKTPDGVTKAYTYEPVWKLPLTIEIKGPASTIKTVYTYDPLYRISTETTNGVEKRYEYFGNTPSVSGIFIGTARIFTGNYASGDLISASDEMGNTFSLKNDANGNPTQMVTPYGTESITYDSLQRPTSTTTVMGENTRYEYDSSGNTKLITTTYSSGKVATVENRVGFDDTDEQTTTRVVFDGKVLFDNTVTADSSGGFKARVGRYAYRAIQDAPASYISAGIFNVLPWWLWDRGTKANAETSTVLIATGAGCKRQPKPNVPRYRVKITFAPGGGVGTVSYPGGSCVPADVDRPSCQPEFDVGVDPAPTPTFTATAASGMQFDRWTCTGNMETGNHCRFPVTASRTIKANFIAGPIFQVTAALDPSNGSAGKIVFTAPTNTDPCLSSNPTACRRTFPAGTRAVLTAESSGVGYAFKEWTGDCSGTNPTCTLTSATGTTTAKNVTAKFLPNYFLSVARNPADTGTIRYNFALPPSTTCSGTPVILNCAVWPCGMYWMKGSRVCLAATATDTTKPFDRWSGNCTGGSCSVTMNSPQSVTANFGKPKVRATLTLSPADGSRGIASVSGKRDGSDVTSPCYHSNSPGCVFLFDKGEPITFGGFPNGGTTVWSGSCTANANACTAQNVQSDISVTATFPCTARGQACNHSGQCCAGNSCLSGVCDTCRNINTACTAHSQCCSGQCTEGVCKNPCVGIGVACNNATPCCGGVSCVGGTCQTACLVNGMACIGSGQCCSGLLCDAFDGRCKPGEVAPSLLR